MELSLDGLSAPVVYSPALEAAIRDVVPAADALDAADFDPTEHINKLFPSEDSLSGVDSYSAELQEQMSALDEEVLLTVRAQTSAGSSARRDLESGQKSVQELFLKVRTRIVYSLRSAHTRARAAAPGQLSARHPSLAPPGHPSHPRCATSRRRRRLRS